MKILASTLFILIAVFLFVLPGCYTQIGVKEDQETEAVYSQGGSDYSDAGTYSGYDDCTLGYRERMNFSYYYPPIFPSEQFAYMDATTWSFDYQPAYSYGYGGGAYSNYSSAYYYHHSPFYPYGQAYTRPMYYSPLPVGVSQTGTNDSQPQGGQGVRDFGNSRSDYSSPAGSPSLPTGASLGTPHIVAPNTGTTNTSGDNRNAGGQRGSTTSPAGSSTGTHNSGSRGGATRGAKGAVRTQIKAPPPNIKGAGTSVDTGRAAPVQVNPPKIQPQSNPPQQPSNNSPAPQPKRPTSARSEPPR